MVGSPFLRTSSGQRAFVAIVLATLPSVTASAFSLTTSALGGYEVLSYRDDTTKLTGGAVSAGDAFEQTSYKGPQFGVNGYASFVSFDGIEPLLGLEVLASQLTKSASSEGYTTKGSFKFITGTIGLGGRLWLGDHFAVNALLGMSQAFSNEMKNSKTSDANGAALGDQDFNFTNHKRTAVHVGASFVPMSDGLMLGLDLRLGSGCFACSSATSTPQTRAYLTRSGSLTVAWLIGGADRKPSNPPINEKLKKVVPRKPQPKKPNVPKFEEYSDE